MVSIFKLALDRFIAPSNYGDKGFGVRNSSKIAGFSSSPSANPNQVLWSVKLRIHVKNRPMAKPLLLLFVLELFNSKTAGTGASSPGAGIVRGIVRMAIGRGMPKCPKEYLSHCHFVHRMFYMVRPHQSYTLPSGVKSLQLMAWYAYMAMQISLLTHNTETRGHTLSELGLNLRFQISSGSRQYAFYRRLNCEKEKILWPDWEFSVAGKTLCKRNGLWKA